LSVIVIPSCGQTAFYMVFLQEVERGAAVARVGPFSDDLLIGIQ
jgi:hypothetical protein